MTAKTQIRIKNVTLSFPAIAEPKAFGENTPAYGAKFAIKPGSEQQKAIEAAMLKVAKEEWKDEGESILNRLIEDGKVAFVKKVYRKKTGEVYAGFEGMHYLSTRNAKTQPTVYDRRNEEVLGKSAIEQQAHSGAVVNASLDVWAQDNKWGRRINCSLRGIMLTGEGENFSGSTPASANDFADLAAPDADDFL
jgi:hypothetical protein